MVCPRCGSVADGPGSACASCGYSSTAPTVAAATATPLPAGATPIPAAGSPGPLAIGEMFGDRYRILKTLGAGGMGVVYQAWDQTLEVAVALKVIRPDAVTDPEAARDLERRFKRELLLARQVTHRNVVRIHDFGEIGGTKYISMPFIEGRDLATLLGETGRLPLARAVEIVRQVAAGLAAAHEAGIVHRDLKPENVMVDADGRPLIMDFGISRSVTGGATAGGLTVTGAVVGTLEYMAPEQARGEAIDQRVDIYALGLMFYDLIVGRRRLERASSPMVELMYRLEQPPPPVRTVLPDVPARIEEIITRALAPEAANRYQTIAELLADLEAFERGPAVAPRAQRQVPLPAVAALVLVALLAAGLAAWWLTRGAPPAAAARDPITVLIADFDNRTGDEVFEGSVEQALGISIEGASFVTSYRRDLARRVLDDIRPGSPLDETGATLVAVREGVKVLLAGAIAPRGGGYEITIRGLDPPQGAVLFTETASASDKADVLRAVGAVSSRVRAQLGDTSAERSGMPPETFTAASLEAMRHYSQAQALSRGRDAEAIERYRAATRLDPNFGRAYSGWAISASRLGRRDEAGEQWKKALALLDRMTERERFRTLGAYALDFTRDYHQAVEHFRTLVERYPADEAGHSNLAVSHFYLLDFGKALEHGRRAVEIYPADVRFRNNVALYAMYAGDLETAPTEARKVLEQDPAFHKAYLPLAAAAVETGDFDAAAKAYDQMSDSGPPGAMLAALGRADLALYQGRSAEALTGIEAAIAADEETGGLALAREQILLAQTHASAGRAQEALRAVGQALGRSDSEEIVVPAAALLVDAGRPQEAEPLAGRLGERLSAQSRAYAKLIEGRVALARGRPAEAIDAFRAGLQLADLWLLRFDLGVAYLEAGPDHAAAALSELENCLARRGEATAVFLNDVPTFRYLAPVHYWLGRAREALGHQQAAVESYRKYLSLRTEAASDPLAADARRRAL